MMKEHKHKSIKTTLSAIVKKEIHHNFGMPFKQAFSKQYPDTDCEEITAAAYICSLFLSTILFKFPTERLHTFVNYTKENYSRFSFNCKMYDTLIGNIEKNALKNIALVDHSGNTVFTECSRKDIKEAFDFYTNS